MREKILQDLGCKSDRENRGEDMYCESCGKNIPDESRFCEYCGSKVIPISVEYSAGEINDETDYDQDIKEEILNTELTESNGTKVEEIAKIEETTEVEKTSAEQVIRISENVTMSSEGSYNWMYEFSLWKNPAIMITVSKVLLIALMVPAMLMFFLTLGDGLGEAFKLLLSMLGIGAALMFVLMIAGYVMLSIAYGGKYYVLFKMDNKGVNHIQLDKQHKKAQALGFLTALIGLSSGNISAAGAGLLGASKKSQYTNFKKVKSVKFSPRMNTVYLNESLNKNQIYAEKEDYLFIKEFILENCPKNVKIVEK